MPADPVPQPLTNEQKALSFFSLEGMGAACTESSFDQQELFNKTITHIRHPDANISLRGIALFMKMGRDLLTVSGALTTLSQSEESTDGNHRRQVTASTTRLLSSLARDPSHESQPRARPTVRTALTSLSPLTPLNPGRAEPLPLPQDAAPPQPVPPTVS